MFSFSDSCFDSFKFFLCIFTLYNFLAMLIVCICLLEMECLLWEHERTNPELFGNQVELIFLIFVDFSFSVVSSAFVICWCKGEFSSLLSYCVPQRVTNVKVLMRFEHHSWSNLCTAKSTMIFLECGLPVMFDSVKFAKWIIYYCRLTHRNKVDIWFDKYICYKSLAWQ